MANNNEISMDELRNQIKDLSASEQTRLFKKYLSQTEHRIEQASGNPWLDYCRRHPEDPLCRHYQGVSDQRSRSSKQEERRLKSSEGREPQEDYLRNMPSGGGCTEAWEYLSEYRRGR